MEEFTLRYPGIEALIREIFPALGLLRDTSASRSASSEPGSSWGELSGEQTAGDFRIVREIGRGGMGIVYEAEQLSIQRRVALKILPQAALADRGRLRRFQNEVRAAATLDHPHIVSIYAVGEERGIHYYSMQLIRGQSLATVIRRLRELQKKPRQELDGRSLDAAAKRVRPRDIADALALSDEDTSSDGPRSSLQTPPQAGSKRSPSADESLAPLSTCPARLAYFRSVARLGVEACLGLEQAHEHGIIHRDIKPANLLLSREGTCM